MILRNIFSILKEIKYNLSQIGERALCNFSTKLLSFKWKYNSFSKVNIYNINIIKPTIMANHYTHKY